MTLRRSSVGLSARLWTTLPPTPKPGDARSSCTCMHMHSLLPLSAKHFKVTNEMA